ncbi:MAG: HEAT repeat domain-containing protein [Spirochaetia bacterium]
MNRRLPLILIATVLASIVPGLAFGQSSTGDDLTVEELYLQNVEIGIIREQAVTTSRDSKLLALDNLQELVDEGKVDQNSAEALYLLDYLAMEGVDRVIRLDGRVINYFPMVRKQACNILGQIGGETAKDILLDSLGDEEEPMVMAEAAYALGETGLDENGEVSRALAFELISQNVTAPDDNFAFAVMLAYEKLAAANNGIREPSVYLSLIQVAEGNYIKPVRDKALEVMDSLRDY